MSDDKHHQDQKIRQRKLEEEKKHHPHNPHKELHEGADLHPHHKQADHVRHHHRAHVLKHFEKETREEHKFINHENYLHRVEMNKELWEDEAGRRQMRRVEKVSATPGLARKHLKGAAVKASISQQVAERLTNLRLRIAFARAKSRERGEMAFGK